MNYLVSLLVFLISTSLLWAQTPGYEDQPKPNKPVANETQTSKRTRQKTQPKPDSRPPAAPKPKARKSTQSASSNKKTSEDKKSALVSMNLPSSVDLGQFIKIIAAETDTVFLYDEKNLKGKTSIISPPNLKMTVDDAFFIFEKLLTSQGLTMIRRSESNIVEVVPAREARFNKLPIEDDNTSANAQPSDTVIRFVPIKHADPNKLKSALSPIFSKTGVILTYAPLNLMVFVDSKSNVDRVVSLIDLLDVEEPESQRQEITLYRMRHNSVEDIHRTTFAIYSNMVRNGKRQEVKFIIEKRMNALIILAKKELTKEILAFIKKIDIPLRGTGAKLTLYELKHTSASSIAPLLSSIFTQSKLAKAVARSASPKKSGKEGSPAPSADSKSGESASGQKFASGSGPVKIIAFDKLNALILIASPGLTDEIIDLVKQLDVERGDVQLLLHPLKYASAQVLAPLLSNIFADQVVAGKGKGQTAAGSRVKVIAEPRLNSLILIAGSFTIQRILTLVNDLDVVQGDSEISMLPLKYASAKDVAPILNQIFAKNAVSTAKKKGASSASQGVIKIMPVTRLNSLIVIGDKIALRQVKDLVSKIDVERGDVQLSFYKLRYASSNTVAPLLKQVFAENVPGAKGKTVDRTAIRIFADQRLNALIIIAGKQDTQEVFALLSQLDVPSSGEESNFKIYSLEYAVAEDMAKMLKEVTRNIVNLKGGKDKKTPQTSSTSSQRGLDISISVDEATNSLLIFAPADVFETIDRIVKKLDVPRPQIYVEALIVEMTLEKSLSLGVDWVAAGPNPTGDSVVSAGTSGAAPLTFDSAATQAAESQLGFVGGGQLQFNEQTFLSFGAFIKATQGDSEINVLSNPQLLMLNNEKATINVSNVIPVATNSSVDANGRVTDQIDFRDIGVILSIKPQISGNDSIRLEIEENFSNVVPSLAGNTVAVTTLKRELKTTIVTADDSIVVLGGLLTEGTNTSESKIPGLGDLPLIGWLFSSSNEAFNKTNLLLFVRSKIVRSQQDLRDVTSRAQDRYNNASRKTSIVKGVIRDMNSEGSPVQGALDSAPNLEGSEATEETSADDESTSKKEDQ